MVFGGFVWMLMVLDILLYSWWSMSIGVYGFSPLW